MFRNTLTGLSKREKEVFDAVCVHLNGCMRRMGLSQLDGEEDQILMDLWLDTFPYKTDENGEIVTHVVYDEVWETVGSGKDKRYAKVLKERVIKEVDFEHSLIESTSIGIYKWRGEQLLINKCKYLFGDRRTRKMVDGKAVTETVIDAWGNARKQAVYEDEIDPKKVSKRNLFLQVDEGDLSKPGEDPITLADIAGSVDKGYEESMMWYDISRVCSKLEMQILHKFMEGYSTNGIYDQLEAEGINFSVSQMSKLKEKVKSVLSPA